MSDYISREAAIKRLSSWRKVIKENFGKNDEYANCLEEAIDKIEDLPAADVREVKRGRWVNDHNGRFSPSGDNYVCSVCGDPALRAFGHPAKTNYCPNCGADMREEQT